VNDRPEAGLVLLTTMFCEAGAVRPRV
jgi:hypothetical protein